VSRSGRNDGVGVDGRESTRVATLALENAGILRCAQNDDVKRTTTTTAKAAATAKTKYRDLSTAAAKCAAFGEMTFVYEGLKENKQTQEQRQEQELAG